MYRNFRNGAALLLLAAAALAAWYFGRRPASSPAAVTQSEDYPLGYYLRDATLLGSNDEGRIAYRLHAGLAEERAGEDRLLLRDVRIDYQPDEQVPWTVTAATGEAPIGKDSYLDLAGGVELTRAATESGRTMRIETDTLRIDPQSQVASAAGAVRISVGQQVLEAVGLKASLKGDHLQLESQVHGRFVR